MSNIQYVDPSRVGPQWAQNPYTPYAGNAAPGTAFPGTYQLVRVSGSEGVWPIRLRAPKGFTISGKASYQIKDGRFLLTVCLNHLATKSKLCVTADVPLAPIMAWVKRSAQNGTIEVGWNPFSAVSNFVQDAGRNIGKGLSSAASSVADAAKRIASNEAVLKIADIIANPSLGKVVSAVKALPVWAKAKAATTLAAAKTGSAAATKKVAEITSLAAGGNNAAMSLWMFMSSMFRGGTPSPAGPAGIWNMFPQMQQQRSVLPFGLPWPVSTSGTSVSGTGPLRFEVGGWLYHSPYRGNLEAMELDKKNPGHILRNLYHGGVNYFPPKIKWPNW